MTLAEWSDVPSMNCWASDSLSQSTHPASPIPSGANEIPISSLGQWESGVFVFLIYFGSIRTPGTTGRGEDRAGHRLRESTVVTPLCRNVSYVRFLARAVTAFSTASKGCWTLSDSDPGPKNTP